MKSQLDRFNRHLTTKFKSIAAFKSALEEHYLHTRSCSETGEVFGVTGSSIRKWLMHFDIPRGSRGGPNFNKGPSVADRINAADQAELAQMTSHEIGKLFGSTGRYVQWLRATGKIPSCDYVGRRKKRG